jgi:hypothetical protein
MVYPIILMLYERIYYMYMKIQHWKSILENYKKTNGVEMQKSRVCLEIIMQISLSVIINPYGVNYGKPKASKN